MPIENISAADEATLATAAEHLNRGGCVAMPTETVYGLAARIDRADAIAAVFQLKERPDFDPLIVHVSSLAAAKSLAREWPPLAEQLAKAFWPGPLTLVLPKAPHVDDRITSGLETVGLRWPRHPLAAALIDRTGGALAAPSANKFGRTSPTTAAHVADEFAAEIAAGAIVVLDGGACEIGLESTVCDINKNTILLLRPGGISQQQIRAVVGSTVTIEAAKTAAESAQSPGHLKHHYMPRKPLIVAWGRTLGEVTTAELLAAGVGDRSELVEISLPEDARMAARALYAELRRADAAPGKTALFLARPLAGADLWQAIDDRLRRAARFQLGEPPRADFESDER